MEWSRASGYQWQQTMVESKMDHAIHGMISSLWWQQTMEESKMERAVYCMIQAVVN